MDGLVAYKHDGKYYANVKKMSLVIGVCDTGEARDARGMKLKWIDENYDDITDLPSDYFDKHPSWQFPEVIKDGNHFRRIPIAYTKRGVVPYGPNYGKWYTMLSNVQKDDFTPHLTAFMYKGKLKDHFLWGMYRASEEAGGKMGAMPGKARWADNSLTWQKFWDAAIANGEGYHMGSMQEWHEILTRALIERKTFDLWNVADRQDYNKNIYRGIHEMAYYGWNTSNSTGACAEFRSGMGISLATSNQYLSAFDEQGNWGYQNTGVNMNNFNNQASSYIRGINESQILNKVYVPLYPTNTPSYFMIPDTFYVRKGVGAIPHVDLNIRDSDGVFNATFHFGATETGTASVTSRLAYIEPN